MDELRKEINRITNSLSLEVDSSISDDVNKRMKEIVDRAFELGYKEAEADREYQGE